MKNHRLCRWVPFRPGGVQGKMKAHIEEKIFAVPAGSLPGKKSYIMK